MAGPSQRPSKNERNICDMLLGKGQLAITYQKAIEIH